MHFDERIAVEPYPAVENRSIEVTYEGLLPNEGADACWIHYGYDGWNSSETKKMFRLADGSFRTAIMAEGREEINFCFKDSANNWDNNDGQNWNVEIKPAYL